MGPLEEAPEAPDPRVRRTHRWAWWKAPGLGICELRACTGILQWDAQAPTAKEGTAGSRGAALEDGGREWGEPILQGVALAEQ